MEAPPDTFYLRRNERESAQIGLTKGVVEHLEAEGLPMEDCSATRYNVDGSRWEEHLILMLLGNERTPGKGQ